MVALFINLYVFENIPFKFTPPSSIKYFILFDSDVVYH